MAGRSFILWLHGLGDSGPANEPIKNLFTSPEFRNTKWSFPSAPHAPVTCNSYFRKLIRIAYQNSLRYGGIGLGPGSVLLLKVSDSILSGANLSGLI
ncbi:acyl-protein thioesterase 1-like protein [Trifolium pratense]|uniref:Acyl-protein thioesterase 1-like protein n=1 Tax=Trifolium pratense TaxID=57577 RepID=A0A2K3JNP0_TRIPR|nr:acyl-protein thioesterase 1-like protein [Trifolium pratense]